MKQNVAINELPVDLCMKVEKVARLDGVSEEEAFLRILDSFFAEGSITTQKRGVMMELAFSSLFPARLLATQRRWHNDDGWNGETPDRPACDARFCGAHGFRSGADVGTEPGRLCAGAGTFEE